jgi:Glycosyl transferase family 11
MRRWFIWFPQGRLGNLIFQYQAISSLSGRGVILALDCEFFDIFDRPRRFLVIPCFKRLRSRLQVIWRRFFQALADRRLIGVIEPGSQIVIDNYAWETLDVFWKTGHLSNIFLIKGFFQTTRYIDPLPKIKKRILRDAENRLAQVSKPDRVAIHMRLGDYTQWSVFGIPGSGCLPASYYLNALAIIKHTVPHAHFFVLSDEPDKARNILESTGVTEQITVVHGGTTESDFALITCCSHAVLSASSYSWWAAMMIASPKRILVAPKYWLGFRKRTWFPPGLESTHFVYIDPLSDYVHSQLGKP